MPSLFALSARLSLIPEPGNTTTPIGSTSSSWSLRLNGAAFLCRVNSGLGVSKTWVRWLARLGLIGLADA